MIPLFTLFEELIDILSVGPFKTYTLYYFVLISIYVAINFIFNW